MPLGEFRLSTYITVTDSDSAMMDPLYRYPTLFLPVLIILILEVNICMAGISTTEHADQVQGNKDCHCIPISKCQPLHKLAVDKKFDDLRKHERCGFEAEELNVCCPKSSAELAAKVDQEHSGGETTTEEPMDPTSALPDDSTTQAPVDTTITQPDDITTQMSMDHTSDLLDSPTTEEPVDLTSTHPDDITTKESVESESGTAGRCMVGYGINCTLSTDKFNVMQFTQNKVHVLN